MDRTNRTLRQLVRWEEQFVEVGQGDEKAQEGERYDYDKNPKLELEIRDDLDYIHKLSHETDISKFLFELQHSPRDASC